MERTNASGSPDHAEAVCEVLNRQAVSNWFIVCEHASDYIPPEFDDLGLEPANRHSHIAWDPGAAGVARHLGSLLDATVVLHRFSRLLFDCNRAIDHPDAIWKVSEGRPVPGNQTLSAAQRQARIDRFYHPFSAEISALLDERRARDQVSILVTVHSFNPVYLGKVRKVELGIINDDTEQLASAFFERMRARYAGVAWNEPYSAADDVTHTLDVHATPRGLESVMIEIRNDLIATDEQQRLWAERLAGGLTEVLAERLP